jgi:hypothetical protein
MQTGFNPMRWDCSKSGCFNKARRPKIEVFHDALPGRISFGDVDGIVEIEGNALVLEWKGEGAPIAKGQEIMWNRLTKSGIFTVFVIEGDAETMVVSSIRMFFRGKLHAPEAADLAAVKLKISAWVSYAKKNSQLLTGAR